MTDPHVESALVHRTMMMPAQMRQQLPEIIHGKDFRNTLTHFIPVGVQARTLDREGFLEHLIRSTDRLLERTLRLIEGQVEEPGEEFQI